ncbi:MAG TPA: hypothetical protein VMQ40_07680, partial [Acidimicrobiales bacterium]|nr:hypothetical protein [Acidimicrobiales bacterium]
MQKSLLKLKVVSQESKGREEYAIPSTTDGGNHRDHAPRLVEEAHRFLVGSTSAGIMHLHAGQSVKVVEKLEVKLITGAVLLELFVIGLLYSQKSITASERDQDRCGRPAAFERADDESPSPSILIAGCAKPLRLAPPRLRCHSGRKL